MQTFADTSRIDHPHPANLRMTRLPAQYPADPDFVAELLNHQHRFLIASCTQLVALTKQDEASQLPQIMELGTRLIEATAAHFEDEDRILLDFQLPQAQHHINEHRFFLANMRHYITALSTTLKLRQQVGHWLSVWLSDKFRSDHKDFSGTLTLEAVQIPPIGDGK